jgi:hypothetical protein
MAVVAVLLAVAASAFTLTTTKATVKTNHKHAPDLYWYEVTYDATHPSGDIPSSSAFYVQAEKDQVTSPCDAGTVKDCLRGFTAPLTSFPNNSAGTDQIKKPNE